MKRYIKAESLDITEGQLDPYDYFSNRFDDYYGPEYDIPEKYKGAIVETWARIAEANSWSGAYYYPEYWSSYGSEIEDMPSEDICDEIVQDGFPDCYFEQAAEEVLGHPLEAN